MKSLVSKILYIVTIPLIVSVVLNACSTQFPSFTKIQYVVLPSELDQQNEPAVEIDKKAYNRSSMDISKLTNEQYEIVRCMFHLTDKLLAIRMITTSVENQKSITRINKLIEYSNNNFLISKNEKNKWATVLTFLQEKPAFYSLDNTHFLKKYKGELMLVMREVLAWFKIPRF